VENVKNALFYNFEKLEKMIMGLGSGSTSVPRIKLLLSCKEKQIKNKIIIQ